MDLLSLSWWRVVFARGGRAFGLGCALVFILPIVITAGFSLRQSQTGQQRTQSGTIASVNGEAITSQEFDSMPSERLSGAPGQQHAQAYGQAMYGLVESTIAGQLAKKLKVHASDADLDRLISRQKESILGANATQLDWENYLSQQKGVAPSDYRDQMQSAADIQALVDHYKNAEIVTLDQAKDQYSEVKLAEVFVPALSPSMPIRGASKLLPDAEALKKANELHDKAVKGQDIIPMAKANPDQFFGSKTGITDWRKENQESQFGSSLMFGKAVDEAVRKTPVNQITPVAKASGFQNGYFFAKVVDRRITLPKDYNATAVMESIKQQRGSKKLAEDIKQAMDKAKITFPKDQQSFKAYYDYARLQAMKQEMSSAMMGDASPNTPTQSDVDVQQKLVDADFEALAKAHPDDATAALMVAQTLQTKMATTPPAEQSAIRDRLIGLYESAFKATEDIPTRFILAGLYHDKQDYKSAYKEYAMVIKLLKDDPGYDLTTRQKELSSRNQLLTGLNGLPANAVPEAAGAAADQTARIAELSLKIKDDQAKQAADRAKQEADQKAEREKAAKARAAATPPAGAGGPVSVVPKTSAGSAAASSSPASTGAASGGTPAATPKTSGGTAAPGTKP